MLNLLNANKKLVVILIVFLLGLYYVSRYGSVEGFDSIRYRCPNILIQKGSNFYLYNSKLAEIPGVNPLQFSNLDEYVEFTKWQRSQGILCPILYVQEVYDTQGNRVYKARPSPTDLQGGLPDSTLGQSLLLDESQLPDASDSLNASDSLLFDAGHDDKPYNMNSYPSFDPQDQYIGLDTPLDKMYHEAKGGISPNAMNANWGGAAYTQYLVDQGYYKGNEVAIAVNN
jgi:hypothetical protein